MSAVSATRRCEPPSGDAFVTGVALLAHALSAVPCDLSRADDRPVRSGEDEISEQNVGKCQEDAPKQLRRADRASFDNTPEILKYISRRQAAADSLHPLRKHAQRIEHP